MIQKARLDLTKGIYGSRTGNDRQGKQLFSVLFTVPLFIMVHSSGFSHKRAVQSEGSLFHNLVVVGVSCERDHATVVKHLRKGRQQVVNLKPLQPCHCSLQSAIS